MRKYAHVLVAHTHDVTYMIVNITNNLLLAFLSLLFNFWNTHYHDMTRTHSIAGQSAAGSATIKGDDGLE